VFNVYSINGIIKASKTLLEEPQVVKKKLIINDHIIASTNSGRIDPFVTVKEKNFLKKSIPEEIEGIILEADEAIEGFIK